MQRTPLAFATEDQAIAYARVMSAATVTRDAKNNYWAVPLERFAEGGARLPGPWNGYQVEVDQCSPFGIFRPMFRRCPR